MRTITVSKGAIGGSFGVKRLSSGGIANNYGSGAAVDSPVSNFGSGGLFGLDSEGIGGVGTVSERILERFRESNKILMILYG